MNARKSEIVDPASYAKSQKLKENLPTVEEIEAEFTNSSPSNEENVNYETAVSQL